ncbi:MAG TPA: hypothetical protein VFH80_01385 [Solirubrobacteraceae bacterium]|nr:hypothetical protein [Solirubrobacteraceae bacterium]
MNYQNDYLVVKAHIDDLVRAAERARVARGIRPRAPRVAWRSVLGRLRVVIGRCPDLTAPEVPAECP